MSSKFSPEKELPEPVYQVSEVRAVAYCPPIYQEQSTTNQQQPQSSTWNQLQPTPTQPQPSTWNQLQSQPAPTQLQPVPSTSFSLTTIDNWVLSQNENLPPQAVHAGYDIDKKLIYVARAYHDGDFITAKAFPQLKLAHFPFQGQEITTDNFEYLTGQKYIWVPAQPFPPGAVVVNPLSANERLYVGRTNYNGSLLCGKFIRSHNRLYVPFGCQEVPINGPCEILVHVDRYSSGVQT